MIGATEKAARERLLKVRELLASNEHETVARTVEVANVAVVRAEPQPTVVVGHTEHDEVAVQISNRLHSDHDPLVKRLVKIL
jgi:hypothetical protein